MSPTQILLLLACAGCSDRVDTALPADNHNLDSPMTLLAAEDVKGYRSGVTLEIALRNKAESLGFAVREEMVDSAAAEAAGLPITRYRAVATTIEALLARGPKGTTDPLLTPEAESAWNQDRGILDSLRLEVLVLRARTSR